MRIFLMFCIVGLVLLYTANVMVDSLGVPSGSHSRVFFGSVLLLVGCVTIVLVRSVVSIYASDSKPEIAVVVGALSAPILALTFANKAGDKHIEIRNATDKHIEVEVGAYLFHESYIERFSLPPKNAHSVHAPILELSVCSDIISCYKIPSPSCDHFMPFGCDDFACTEFIQSRSGEVSTSDCLNRSRSY